MKIGKYINRKRLLFSLLFVAIVGVCVWKCIRSTCKISCQAGAKSVSHVYTEQESVIKAISLSYLVYGCERCEDLSGTISDLIDNNEMRILIENFGIKRANKKDPSSARFDSAEFIRENVGDFRYLTSLRDTRSSFYGAAFCDDENKCIWISYSGSVSFLDVIACMQLVLAPGLSAQEKLAFELYNTVMDSDEVKSQSYSVILTGHSLGGAFASMISRMSGCTAITINGADGVALDKINDIVGETPTVYNIVNYMTCPKNGKFSFMDMVQRLMFLGSYKTVDYSVYEENGLTTDTHSVFSFILFTDEGILNPELPVAIEEARKNKICCIL